MRRLISAALGLALTLTAAAEPATQPVAESPTTAPATQPTASHFPTPAELIEQFKQLRAKKEALLKVAYLDLSSPMGEAPAGVSLFGSQETNTLRSILDRLDQARTDETVRAVLITLGADTMELAQAQEIREQITAVEHAGKPVFVYADSYGTATYTLASSAEHICILEGGEILMPGLSATAMFGKGLLDKVGVQADFVQIGEYKGASEPYTRTESSVELRGETNRLLDALYEEIVTGISDQRGLNTDQVRDLIDGAFVPGAHAKESGLVDHLVDQDGLRELIKTELGDEIDLLHHYGEPEKEELDFSNPFLLLAQLSKKPPETDKPLVALIYIDGTIVDGTGGESLLGSSGVGGEDIRRAMRMAGRDEQVQAVVLRINSPGGSALASEVMWQAVRRVARDKPVVISVGGMAASGGYYVASAGDYIFSDPAGIVGSIGVVGGKFVAHDLFDKLGITTETISRGQNAGLFSSDEPFTERQRKLVTERMTQVYDLFTQRVMTTRAGRIQDIDAVARGRIFAARQAKDLGMVDELGGLRDAIAHAAGQADLEEGDYDVKILPPPPTLQDLIMGRSSSAATPITPQAAAPTPFHLLPQSLRQAVLQQAQMMRIMERNPVMIISPVLINVE